MKILKVLIIVTFAVTMCCVNQVFAQAAKNSPEIPALTSQLQTASVVIGQGNTISSSSILRLRNLAVAYLQKAFPGQIYKYTGYTFDKKSVFLTYKRADGAIINVQFDRLTSAIKGAELQKTTYSYNPNHTIKEASKLSESYNADGKIISSIQINRHYDAKGRFLSSDTTTLTYTYNTSGNLIKKIFTDRTITITTTFYTSGRVESETYSNPDKYDHLYRHYLDNDYITLDDGTKRGLVDMEVTQGQISFFGFQDGGHAVKSEYDLATMSVTKAYIYQSCDYSNPGNPVFTGLLATYLYSDGWIRTTYDPLTGNKTAEFRYDKQGNLTTKTEYSDGYRKTKNSFYDNAGKLFYYWEYLYDSKGNCIKSSSYNGNDVLTGYSEFDYDANNNKIRVRYYDGNGNLTEREENEYDATGNKTKAAFYDSNGNLFYSWEWTYDSNSNCTKFSSYDGSGKLMSYSESDYDSNNNKIRVRYYDGNGNLTEREECEYDANGNETKTSFYDAINNLIYNWEWEYDSKGNCVKFLSYNNNGKLMSYSESDYDSNNNKIKDSYYDGVGNLTEVSEYSYSNITATYTYYVPSGRVHTRTDINGATHEYSDAEIYLNVAGDIAYNPNKEWDFTNYNVNVTGSSSSTSDTHGYDIYTTGNVTFTSTAPIDFQGASIYVNGDLTFNSPLISNIGSIFVTGTVIMNGDLNIPNPGMINSGSIITNSATTGTLTTSSGSLTIQNNAEYNQINSVNAIVQSQPASSVQFVSQLADKTVGALNLQRKK